MITAGDMEFEIPGLSKKSEKASPLKTVPLNSHIVAMTAGNAGFQADAIQHLFPKVKIAGGGPGSLFSNISVRDVATLYLDFCNEQRKIATNSVLAPYGLNVETYVEKQRSLSDQFVRWITSEVEDIRERVGDPVLFCGIDATGAHIILTNGNALSSCDPFGFAAIGSGGEHAESQFMLGGHTKLATMAETVLLTYVAKKRSEVAPGVGELTDMFIVGVNGVYYVRPHELDRLNAAYRKLEAGQARSLVKAKAEITAYVNQLQEQARKLSHASPPPIEPPSAQQGSG